MFVRKTVIRQSLSTLTALPIATLCQSVLQRHEKEQPMGRSLDNSLYRWTDAGMTPVSVIRSLMIAGFCLSGIVFFGTAAASDKNGRAFNLWKGKVELADLSYGIKKNSAVPGAFGVVSADGGTAVIEIVRNKFVVVDLRLEPELPRRSLAVQIPDGVAVSEVHLTGDGSHMAIRISKSNAQFFKLRGDAGTLLDVAEKLQIRVAKPKNAFRFVASNRSVSDVFVGDFWVDQKKISVLVHRIDLVSGEVSSGHACSLKYKNAMVCSFQVDENGEILIAVEGQVRLDGGQWMTVECLNNSSVDPFRRFCYPLNALKDPTYPPTFVFEPRPTLITIVRRIQDASNDWIESFFPAVRRNGILFTSLRSNVDQDLVATGTCRRHYDNRELCLVDICNLETGQVKTTEFDSTVVSVAPLGFDAESRNVLARVLRISSFAGTEPIGSIELKWLPVDF